MPHNRLPYPGQWNTSPQLAEGIMADFWRDFWIRETGTGQQVAQLLDRYMMMMIVIATFVIATVTRIKLEGRECRERRVGGGILWRGNTFITNYYGWGNKLYCSAGSLQAVPTRPSGNGRLEKR
jgi:hypothetical protein